MRYRSYILGPGISAQVKMNSAEVQVGQVQRIELIYSPVIRLYLGQIAMNLHGFTVCFVNN